MKRTMTKLRPAVTAALAFSMAVPAPIARAAELEALEEPESPSEEGASPEDETVQPPPDGPPPTPPPPGGAAAAVHSTVFSDSTISSFFSFRWAARLTTREKTAVSTPA